jgi:hypothetical protein
VGSDWATMWMMLGTIVSCWIQKSLDRSGVQENFTPTPPLCLEDEDGTDQIGAHSEAISEYNNSCGNA